MRTVTLVQGRTRSQRTPYAKPCGHAALTSSAVKCLESRERSNHAVSGEVSEKAAFAVCRQGCMREGRAVRLWGAGSTVGTPSRFPLLSAPSRFPLLAASPEHEPIRQLYCRRIAHSASSCRAPACCSYARPWARAPQWVLRDLDRCWARSSVQARGWRDCA